jgi:hypothetical protein
LELWASSSNDRPGDSEKQGRFQPEAALRHPDAKDGFQHWRPPEKRWQKEDRENKTGCAEVKKMRESDAKRWLIAL